MLRAVVSAATSKCRPHGDVFMADDSKQPALNIGGNTFILALLAAAGTYLVAHQLPLEDSRPNTTEKTFISEGAGEQDVDARLWQDPFTAVADLLGGSPELKVENCNDKLKHHCESPLNAPGPAPPLAMIVSVSGAPYAEDHEFRRRTRYAILAGLNAEGYVPEDPEHIGFYWPQVLSTFQLPTVLPFEWLKPKSSGKMLPYRRVLLLWFNEDVLSDTPLKHFAHFLCWSLLPYATSNSANRAKVKILGPQSSTTLQSMVDEIEADPGVWSSERCPDTAPFYVYSATADDAILIPSYPSDSPCFKLDNCLIEFFQNKHINVYRTISTDQALARTIRDELSLRRIEQNDHSHIALISEWDTVYARALPESMLRCLGERVECLSSDVKIDKPWLHPFKYLRGLDGQMPEAKGSSGHSKDEDKKEAKSTEDATVVLSNPKARDRAEGQGQFDYLRRLGDRLQQLDMEWRQQDSKGIEAVGILGSDVHDKLLILQALRPLFPRAWFFTTDLDALLLHPIASTPTRNLLVASSFGLQLRPDIQGELPPFRSGYQTAGFLASRLAIRTDDAPPSNWFTPLLFEIGSSREFQFSSQSPNDLKAPRFEGERSDHKVCGISLLSCEAIHPLASMMAPEMSLPSSIAISVAVLILVLSFRGLRHRTFAAIEAIMRGSKGYAVMTARLVAVMVGLALVVFALSAVTLEIWPRLAAWMTEGGQPITVLEGISVWPTICLRMAAFFLCVWFIADSWWQLDENIKKIAKDLDLVETRKQAKAAQDAFLLKRPWIRFASYFWYRDDETSLQTHVDTPSQQVLRFWRMYVYQGHWSARLFRVSTGVIAMIIFWLILSGIFGNPPPPRVER
jgi:hypothetical protein